MAVQGHAGQPPGPRSDGSNGEPASVPVSSDP